MGNKRIEDRKNLIKKEYEKVKKIVEDAQAKLELNYYVQKKMMDHPEKYIDEIKKDIRVFEEE
jgi:hypothetical protein